jgi:hypothetical protein
MQRRNCGNAFFIFRVLNDSKAALRNNHADAGNT